MLKLYYAPQTRAVRARWMLEEIGAPYELVRLDLSAREQKNPEYLKLNPNGTVPTLVDDDLILYESAAIVQYLADKFPEKHLAPAVGTAARGRYYQWIHYAMNALEPPAVTFFLHTTGARLGRPQHERLPQLVPEAKVELEAALKVVDDNLAGKDFMLGQQFTGADVMIAALVGWCAQLGVLGEDNENLSAYLMRMGSRPALVRSLAD